MRFGIFAVMAGRKAGGPETYEHSLLDAIAKLDHTDDFHIYCLSRGAADSFGARASNLHYHVLGPGIRWISIAATLPLKLMSTDVDLMHATFTPPPFSPKPYVFTHHCFSTFAHPEFYDPAILLRLNGLIQRGIKRARLILCVSENVRDLTAEKFGIPHERMRVVYNGVGEQFRPLDLEQVRKALALRYQIHEPYVLYVGKLEARKNIVRLLEAFNQVRHEAGRGVKLVLAGGRTPTSQGIDEAIARLGLRDDLIELGHLPNADLPLLYAGAQLFAFPSLWEGFGIPVVEAMACGTPVLTSNLSALPEIAGGAALLVNPYSTAEIAAAMNSLLEDGELVARLRLAGIERARQFNWQATAEGTLAAYRQALSS